MKVRTGFVSNSSSSSFILASKKELTEAEMKDIIRQDPEFTNLINKMVEKLASKLIKDKPKDVDTYAKYEYGEHNEETKRWSDKGYTKIYRCCLWSDGDSIEEALSAAFESHTETEDFAISANTRY